MGKSVRAASRSISMSTASRVLSSPSRYCSMWGKTMSPPTPRGGKLSFPEDLGPKGHLLFGNEQGEVTVAQGSRQDQTLREKSSDLPGREIHNGHHQPARQFLFGPDLPQAGATRPDPDPRSEVHGHPIEPLARLGKILHGQDPPDPDIQPLERGKLRRWQRPWHLDDKLMAPLPAKGWEGNDVRSPVFPRTPQTRMV